MAEPMTRADEVEFLVARGMTRREAEDSLAAADTQAATAEEIEQQRAELR